MTRTTLKLETFTDHSLLFLAPPLFGWKLLQYYFTWLFGDLASRLTLPARNPSIQAKYFPTAKNFPDSTVTDVKPIKVPAADGASLQTYVIEPEGDKKLHVIWCAGNSTCFADYYHHSHELFNQCKAEGIEIIGFDYRKVNKSTGSLRSLEDLINDGIAQGERLIAQGVDSEKIVYYGHSLGGTVASGAAAYLHRHGKNPHVFIDRSLSSIPRVIEGFIRGAFNATPALSFSIQDDQKTAQLVPKNALIYKKTNEAELASEWGLFYYDAEGEETRLPDVLSAKNADVTQSSSSLGTCEEFEAYLHSDNPKVKQAFLKRQGDIVKRHHFDFGPDGYSESFLGKALGLLARPFIDCIISLLGWGRLAAADFAAIPAQNKEYMLIRGTDEQRKSKAPGDLTIHESASLHRAVSSDDSPSSHRFFFARRNNLHGASLSEIENDQNQTGSDFFMSFLRSRKQPPEVKKEPLSPPSPQVKSLLR